MTFFSASLLRAASTVTLALLALTVHAKAGVPDLVIAQRGPFAGNDIDFLDAFAGSVAIDGDTAVVGAVLADAPGADGAGAAYVFTRSGTTWTQQAKLTAEDASEGQSFGQSVAISGATIAVGASTDGELGTGAGAAYVFTRTGTLWSQQQKVVADDLGGLETFGGSVALEGNTLVVGAFFGSGVLPFSGAAYVFVREQGLWEQQTKLFALDGAPLQGFGSSVDISGFTILVGAQGDGGTGAAYVFVGALTIWVQQAKLNAATPGSGDAFGGAVALEGDLAVVGAAADDDSGEDSGSAFVFARTLTSWAQQARLMPSTPAAENGFGTSVALSGNHVLVGASTSDDDGQDSGSSFLFEQTGSSWNETAKLTASDAAALHRFGEAVALDGERALIGSPVGGFIATGAGYVYDFLGENGAETCAGARAISGPGTFAFDTTQASSDGPPHAACSFGGDVWYRWTAACDGTVSVDTCGGTALDTSIAVYSGTCPASAVTLLDCDDDTCGAQSSVSFPVLTGDSYLIRIGGESLIEAGIGTFSLEVDCDIQIPQCPFMTVTGRSGASPLSLARRMRTLYRFRDGVLRGTPTGERWVELYYRHAPEMNRILRADPELRSRIGALIEVVEPGLRQLASTERSRTTPRLSPRALVLFDRIVSDLAEAAGSSELARDLRRERERIPLEGLMHATYDEAWSILSHR